MKKTFLLIGSLLLIIQSFAQISSSKTLEKRARKYTNEIVEYVSEITIEQEKQLFEINVIVTRQFDSLKRLELESDEYKPAARAVFKNRDAVIKKILNVNQWDEFLMLQEEKRDAAFKKKKEFQNNKNIAVDSAQVK